MTNGALHNVLEATGYIVDGAPAHGVHLGEDARRHRRGRQFEPDALWRGPSALTVYFKYSPVDLDDQTISAWHREIWNEGFAPLLWLVSPKRIELYNGFGRPETPNDASRHRLRTFETIEQQLKELDHLAGRLAMETGQFWLHTTSVNRKGSVDEQLLSDLASLESDLIAAELDRPSAQGLIGRSIFAQYLIDRDIVTEARLAKECGTTKLPNALRRPQQANKLFGWLADVFNGDMFPPNANLLSPNQKHLARVADFLEAVNPNTGQTTFFPYQFDVIPVELISSIYEQFAHSNSGSTPRENARVLPDTMSMEARRRGVHYTRLPVVSLILDEVMAGATGNETVLDLTCGSGVFLVEALRRLVARKGGERPSRDLIRSTLYHQIYGVDISDAAIRVAAFSLYLAALELDPNPQPPEALKFERLIGRTLLIGDARGIETSSEGASLLNPDGERRKFDVIVGNPPWTFRGKAGTRERRPHLNELGASVPLQPRGEGFDFVLRATDFAHERTRYGIVLSAMPFFAGSKTGANAARYIIEHLSPATLINLAPLTKWLFPTASMPAVVLLARHRAQSADHLTVVNVPWSPSAEKSYSFEISPGDISVLPISAWASDPGRLKATTFGRGRDLSVLDDLRRRYGTLDKWLQTIGASWRDGLILGRPENRTRDARHLTGLELLTTSDLEHFCVPEDLPRFDELNAQWPRNREVYKAPILLIKEFFKSGPRPVSAISERDLVYTDAYFGAALPRDLVQSGRLVSAILSSALGSWFFLMTASEFGVWKRRLFKSDVGALPLPMPQNAVDTPAGRELLALETMFRLGKATADDWEKIDNAVFNLYDLDDSDRMVIRDGLLRAGWQWSGARNLFSQPATLEDLDPYARAFMDGFDAWLQATRKRHIRAEVIDLPQSSPLRVVRFALGEGRRDPEVQVVNPVGDLSEVLSRIGQRLHVQLGASLIGERELRVHGDKEVVIIKPAARRFWMQAVGLEDADTVVSESFTGAAA
jgi:hypothetical protein